MKTLNINTQRLEEQLATLATYSDAPSPAVTRILFTPTELEARAYIRDLMTAAGLSVREDAIGNIFGTWQGSDSTFAPIATGSHIDAIPHSGRYDGTVGVLGAIEAVNALRETGFTPQRSIEIIMFTSEEPTRFGIGCLGSRAMAGILTPDDLLALRDTDDMPFDTVRQAAGYTESLSSVQLERGTYDAFIELHIEQGSRLETADNKIGIVTAIAAPATLRVIINGDGGHAGTVLMPDRHDALTAAAEIILAVERAAHDSPSPDAVATVGLCDVHPNAVNSIPSQVLLEIDIRDIDLTSRDNMVSHIQTTITQVCDRRGCQAETHILNANNPALSSEALVATLVDIAQTQGYPHQTLVSRAYHDTLFMDAICPTAMIFVPSENGYSHRPEEYTSIEDITTGVDVLARALAHYASQ